jgi:hypothetical protein
VPYHPLLSAPRERLAAGPSLVVPGESLGAISSPAVCAVNAGHEWLGMRRGRRCLRNSPSGADTGDVQVLDTRETPAVGSGEGGGAGAPTR